MSNQEDNSIEGENRAQRASIVRDTNASDFVNPNLFQNSGDININQSLQAIMQNFQNQIEQLSTQNTVLRNRLTGLETFANNQPINQIADPIESFVLNPYLGNINPGTTSGQKLWAAAVAREDKRLRVEPKNATLILNVFQERANKFGWAPLIGDIRVNGQVHNIFKDYRELTLSAIQNEAAKTWNSDLDTSVPLPENLVAQDLNPANVNHHRLMFYRRTKSQMIAKKIDEIIDSVSIKKISLDKKKFEWTDSWGQKFTDGPTKLYVILRFMNPNTRVAINNLKQKIIGAKLKDYDNNISEGLDDLCLVQNEIIDAGGTMDDMILHLFSFLEQAPNDEFQRTIGAEKDKWEADQPLEVEKLCDLAKQKFNNISSRNKWNILNPKDAKILALTTENNNPKTTSSGSKKISIEDWRRVKKQDSVIVNGKTWHWCPHHKHPNNPDGLYVTHRAEDHDQWKLRRDQFKGQAKPKSISNDNNNVSTSESKDKLQLSSQIKSVLMSDCQLTPDEAAALVEKMSLN